MRTLPLPGLALALLLTPLRAAEDAPTPAPTQNAPAGAAAPSDHRAEEYAGLLRIAARKLEARDGPNALVAAREALRLARGAEHPPALLALARAHRVSGDGVRAVAAYEHLLREHPDWDDVPLAMLELGRALRDLGAPRLAIARFYGVIQSTLSLPAERAQEHRQIVRTAQFEIAETHLAEGNGAEAVRFFRRLELLDLAPADRARARFRVAQAQLQDGDRAAAIATLARFLARDGEATEAAEARFLLARLHAEDGRRDEALRVTLDLLRGARASEDGAAAHSWRRRAGHFLASRFLEEGETHSALLLYRAMAAHEPEPAWRAPLLYQIGLCLERLDQAAEARAAYDELVSLIGPEPAPAKADLLRMARWRAEQLEWAARVHQGLRDLARPDAPVTPAPPAPALPAPTPSS
jgi:TolA-binding protein